MQPVLKATDFYFSPSQSMIYVIWCLECWNNFQVEQAMYLYTLENEEFLTALANTKICFEGSSMTTDDESETIWEIVRAQKCDWKSS